MFVPGVNDRQLRNARLPILFCVEHAEVFADDFRLRIALDPFRAGIPTGHMAVTIQTKNGVIVNAVKQGTEPLFAFPKRFPGAQALRDLSLQGDVGRGQFRGTLANAFFQFIPCSSQRAVLRLDLGQHLVEGIGQHPDLISTLLFRTDGIVLILADDLGGVCQA